MSLHRIEHFSNLGEVSTIASRQLGEAPVFHSNVFIRDCYVGSWTEIGVNTQMVESTLDDYSYAVSDNQIIYSKIGKFSNIASHVRINPGNHPIERVTLHHITYRRRLYGVGEDDTEFFNWRREHPCTIGHDTWLGHNVIIMPGVTVGNGAVVGSGAVVTHDVEPYTIVVGVPARPLRRRFPQAISDALERIAWWNWDHETLKTRIDDLLDVEKFVEKYG